MSSFSWVFYNKSDLFSGINTGLGTLIPNISIPVPNLSKKQSIVPKVPPTCIDENEDGEKKVPFVESREYYTMILRSVI